MRSLAGIGLAVVACGLASACGGNTSPTEASVAAQRDVAQRFAEAIFHGNAGAATALLVKPDGGDLSSLVTRAAAPWKARHGTVSLPGRRSGQRWIFGFAGTHTHKDGRFERLRGHILVVVKAPSSRPRVSFFAYRNDHVLFSTHHDSVLLPSNR
jgi:hypothetical protein